MEQRILGRTGRHVSVVGLGTWQLGGDWGHVDDAMADEILHAAVAEGITFFDTADVYGDGRSEQLIGDFLRRTDGTDSITVATKFGRRADQVPESFTRKNLRAWADRSRRNLGVDQLQLVQLHCPPSAVLSTDAVFDDLDVLVDEGVVAHYGVSVETVDEALTAITRPHVATVQIIANAFRLKPLEQVFPAAADAGVGIIVRVPLASGLLSGKYDENTTFASDDHRSYNRDGSAFDVGETFSGVDFEVGITAARQFSELVRRAAPEGATSAQAAIAWLCQNPAVSTVIPGARSVGQVRDNAAAGRLPHLGPDFTRGVVELYDERLRHAVHSRW
ncbi:aldo/keto reductase [Knoellia sp. CPCC 206450]|uniref:aldo/keto reductase n=1 Tax=Knoellia tibetensis TaxID=3404798 RepID=UPI003B431D6E